MENLSNIKYLKYKSKYLNFKNNINYHGGSNENNIIKAIAVFSSQDNVKGTVNFEQINEDNVRVIINLEGFKANTIHGFHVHESGDLSKGCESMCGHFNPFNKNHGDRNDIDRHVGDLGNLVADDQGKVNIEFVDNIIKLDGNQSNIIGRGLIIHADPDDCGKTNHSSSKITGNSGKRIACAIIGYASKC